MTPSTTDNEATAIQGLLALHESENHASTSINLMKRRNTDILYWHSPFSQRSSPPSLNSPYSSLAYASPINNENDDYCLVQGMNTMTTNENISPTALLSLERCSNNNKDSCHNETQQQHHFIYQSQEQAQQFQEFQQQAFLAHQAQLVRQSQEPRYKIITQQQHTALPSIQEMMAYLQRPLLSRDGPTRASIIPCHSFHNKRPLQSDFHGIHQRHKSVHHQQSQQRQLAKNQQKSTAVVHQRNSQLIELNVLMQSQQNHRVLASLCNCTDADLQAFFQCLRQFYLDEYDEEQNNRKNQQQESASSISEKDEDEEDDYQPPIASGSSVAFTKSKKSYNIKKKSNGSADKPRWTAQERSELLEAIVRHKSLEVMSTFDWAAIGQDIGRLDKACKDQWRRGILKMFRKYIANSNIM